MRLIDADRLKSYIDCGHLRPPTEVCFSELDVCNMIDKAPTVSAEAVQGWIPVSERLPDIKEHHVSDPCLVYCENGVYGFAELEENIFGQVGWNCEREDEYHELIGDVLAWMPLPEPYKAGDSE